MTPQLQQAIKLLQLSRMELVDLIQTEMVENPMLEEAPDDTGPVELGTDRLAAEVMDHERSDDTAQAEQAVQEIDWERY
ncbi:MAG: RNA polymerase sigma-54 factor, partial [Bdellovibrionales bacterium]|nr:RNA polymerase sigma-54 factor [Bdellovibrionales bacterium]